MRENRLYGSEGAGALTRSPYPYRRGIRCPGRPDLGVADWVAPFEVPVYRFGA